MFVLIYKWLKNAVFSHGVPIHEHEALHAIDDQTSPLERHAVHTVDLHAMHGELAQSIVLSGHSVGIFLSGGYLTWKGISNFTLHRQGAIAFAALLCEPGNAGKLTCSESNAQASKASGNLNH